MSALFEFFELYFDPDAVLGGDFGVVMLVMYASAALYMLDFYQLVKRKSQAETMGIFVIPFGVSMMGAALAAMMLTVPRPDTERIALFGAALENRKLQAYLVLLSFLWVILWGICYLLQRKRERKQTVRWVISCIPDAVFAAVIIFSFLYLVFCGKSLFSQVSGWVLWAYLYAVYLLSCKTVLLAVGLIVRLYSARLTLLKWHEGKNPSAFLFRYYYVYQNAILRNVLLFEGAVLTFLTVALVMYPPGKEELGDIVMVMLFLYLCAAVTITIASAPVRKSLGRFKKWGDAKRLKELFCREYFTLDPVSGNAEYVVTRHFLIDVQRPAAIYYWGDLRNVGGWYPDGKGKSRSLYFEKAGELKISEKEAAAAEGVFAYAKWYVQMQNHFAFVK